MGVQVTTDPPEQATLADRQLSHHFPLSQTQPRPAMAWNSSSLGHLQPKAGVRFLEMARSKVLGASEKRGSFSFAIEQFYFRPSWPG